MSLVDCAAEGNVEALLHLLASPDVKVNEPGKDGTTSLCAATMWGHEDIVKMLLHHRDIEVNKCNTNAGKSTALHLACMQEQAAIVDLLLEEGADIYVLDSHGVKPVDYASCSDILWPKFQGLGATRTGKEHLLKLGVIRRAEDEEVRGINGQGNTGVVSHVSRPESSYVRNHEINMPLTARNNRVLEPIHEGYVPRAPLTARGAPTERMAHPPAIVAHPAAGMRTPRGVPPSFPMARVGNSTLAPPYGITPRGGAGGVMADAPYGTSTKYGSSFVPTAPPHSARAPSSVQCPGSPLRGSRGFGRRYSRKV